MNNSIDNIKKIALVGNPNTGKSSVFNFLTGLNQKIGNFAGVTVEQRSGEIHYQNKAITVLDLPGIYSLYPNSYEEFISLTILLDEHHSNHPDAIIYVLDANNLERNCLLLSQLIDLKFKIIVAINMLDVAENNFKQININEFEQAMGIPCVAINGRNGIGITSILDRINTNLVSKSIYKLNENELKLVEAIEPIIQYNNPYKNLLIAHNYKKLSFIKEEEKSKIEQQLKSTSQAIIELQLEENLSRYNAINSILKSLITYNKKYNNTFSDKIDATITHPIWGMVIFFGILFFLFQAIFTWSSIPMDFIDTKFAQLSFFIAQQLPEGLLTRLITQGIIPGISGVIIFVPQIFFLFLILTLLEDVGYMSRVIYLFDNTMQRFGLNGRSIISLVSGGACAVPAIMSTRTISNKKERLISILVTPFISCSARIPVYVLLIAFVVPNVFIYKLFSLQALFFMFLYILSIIVALVSSYILNKLIQQEESSYLILELPEYKLPHWRNVYFEVYNKVKSFVWDAGRIIVLISIILWFLSSYGPNLNQKKHQFKQEASLQYSTTNEIDNYVRAKLIEHSYIGIFGKIIEPIIQPLGYDWKIGIAILTSFAAREVFVGTISTLYSINEEASTQTIKQKLAKQINPVTKQKIFTPAVALSLIIFYLLAMQCMSTLVIVYKETKSIAYPILQFIVMTIMAYSSSFIIYQLFK